MVIVVVDVCVEASRGSGCGRSIGRRAGFRRGRRRLLLLTSEGERNGPRNQEPNQGQRPLHRLFLLNGAQQGPAVKVCNPRALISARSVVGRGPSRRCASASTTDGSDRSSGVAPAESPLVQNPCSRRGGGTGRTFAPKVLGGANHEVLSQGLSLRRRDVRARRQELLQRTLRRRRARGGPRTAAPCGHPDCAAV